MNTRFVVMCICAAVVGVLAYFAAVTVTFVPGVAALYPAAAFETAFGAWFGLWGAAASFLGLLIAGSVGGWFSIQLGLLLSLSDFILALAPAVAVRRRWFDCSLPTRRDALCYWGVSLLLGSLPGSLLYNYVNLSVGALAGWSSFWVAVLGWNIGNAVVIAVIGVPLMRIGGPLLVRRGLIFRR